MPGNFGCLAFFLIEIVYYGVKFGGVDSNHLRTRIIEDLKLNQKL